MHKFSREHIHIGKSMGDFASCVIDVGCYSTGAKGKFYKNKFNVPCIFIDADVLALEKLKVDQDDLIINSAVSSLDGIGILNIYQECTHSLLETNVSEIEKYIDGFTGKPGKKEDWEVRDRLFVPKLKLSSIIESLKITEIKALKIDAQGHDFEVVQGLEKYINIVNFLELEVQIGNFVLYKNQSSKQDIVTYMEKNNFSLVHSESQTFGQEENLYFQREG
jgi:FkbM family methyltransferase